MEPIELITGLTARSAYPVPPSAVEVRQTHLSAVFLAGPYVYKVKKPVRLPFVDFTTLEAREHFCREEVRLNRRLAPDVYLDVVPVVRGPHGLHFEADGPPIDWAVKMRRLPDAATLQERLAHGQVTPDTMHALAHRLADFHRHALRNDQTAAAARFEPVRQLIRDVLALGAPLVGLAVHPDVFARLTALFEDTLTRFAPVIDARADRGIPCEGHGDLRLDHVYHFPDQPPPADLAIIDCIEFQERFRYLCPIADLAFLTMDLTFQGRPDLADALAETYFSASADDDGRPLLPLYVAYRAAVRGAVAAPLLAETEVPKSQRDAALKRARGRWLLALSELEPPQRRPLLILMAGLPGSGKSTVAQGLADRAGFEVFRSDVVRNELAAARGVAAEYNPAWDEWAYVECRRRAEEVLFRGGRVIIDATFREERRRLDFLRAAHTWGVPVRILHCHANDALAHQRLAARRGDASSADATIRDRLAALWEPFGPESTRLRRPVDTTGTIEDSIRHALVAIER